MLADDGALEFDNLHVDLGQELVEEVSGVDWFSDDSMDVSVLFPIDVPADPLTDLPLIHDVSSAGGDWWF